LTSCVTGKIFLFSCGAHWEGLVGSGAGS
jgi:hypothetical protein